jgi:hypothetical protein
LQLMQLERMRREAASHPVLHPAALVAEPHVKLDPRDSVAKAP